VLVVVVLPGLLSRGAVAAFAAVAVVAVVPWVLLAVVVVGARLRSSLW